MQCIEEFITYGKIAQLLREVSNEWNGGRGERGKQEWEQCNQIASQVSCILLLGLARKSL